MKNNKFMTLVNKTMEECILKTDKWKNPDGYTPIDKKEYKKNKQELEDTTDHMDPKTSKKAYSDADKKRVFKKSVDDKIKSMKKLNFNTDTLDSQPKTK